jgi:rhodanese-related sulfurtransferase
MRSFSWIGLVMLAALGGCSQPGGTAATSGLSCTPQEAFRMWQAAPDKVYILDVRTSEEYVFIGHAPMARNIPVKFMQHKWDAKENKPVFKINPDFVPAVKKAYATDDKILVMCGSGVRGAAAVKILKDAGFTNVSNIEGGFEGLRGKDCSDHGVGRFVKPGWKNSGLTWTWLIDPESVYIAE